MCYSYYGCYHKRQAVNPLRRAQCCDPPIMQIPNRETTERRAMLMLTIEGLVAVFSLILAAFGLGYTIGHNDRTQK